MPVLTLFGKGQERVVAGASPDGICRVVGDVEGGMFEGYCRWRRGGGTSSAGRCRSWGGVGRIPETAGRDPSWWSL